MHHLIVYKSLGLDRIRRSAILSVIALTSGKTISNYPKYGFCECFGAPGANPQKLQRVLAFWGTATCDPASLFDRGATIYYAKILSVSPRRILSIRRVLSTFSAPLRITKSMSSLRIWGSSTAKVLASFISR